MLRILFIDAADNLQKLADRFNPLWPAYLAAFAEKELGAEKFDFRILNSPIEKELDAFKPHIVAISSVTGNFSLACQFARLAKTRGVPVIIGGCHISCLPQNLSEDMDVGCIGEGVDTFTELMDLFLKDGSFRPDSLASVKGIVYRDGKSELRITQERPVCDLERIPHPKRSLIGYQRTDTMFTSRGCPYNCIFCSVTRFWKEMRYNSSDYVMDEIAELIDNKVKIIKIYDDLFTAHRKRLRTIAEDIQRRGFDKKARFTCWARANTVTPDVVESLKMMNIVSVEMGLETGCDRTLQYLKGGCSIEGNSYAVNLLKDAGMEVKGSFIFGLPDETPEEVEMTYDFIKNSRLDGITIKPLVPLPGTPIWDYALEKGHVTNEMDNWNDVYRVFVAEKITPEEMEQFRKRFKRITSIIRWKAVPRSPWLMEAPKILAKRLSAKAISTLFPPKI